MNNRRIKRVIIRLYRQFDIDLIYMFEIMLKHDIEPQSFIHKILHSYIAGETPFNGREYEFADEVFELLDNNNDEYIELRRKIQYILLLDEYDDSAIIQWLNGIEIGYRNMAIKAVIRSFLSEPYLVPCMSGASIAFIGKDAKCETGNSENDKDITGGRKI